MGDPCCFPAAATHSGCATSASAAAASCSVGLSFSLPQAVPPSSASRVLVPHALLATCSISSLLSASCHPRTLLRRQQPLHVMAEQGDGINAALPRTPQTAFSAIDFLMLCQKLKTTKRAGWVNHKLKDSESIADHMYRMGIMALIASDVPGVKRDRCVKMALVHDIAEAIVGDITPADNIPKEKKSAMERAAIENMCEVLGDGPAAEEVKELWSDYEDNLTPEAKLVKDFDKVELILQAVEYEKDQGKNLDDFFRTTAGKFQTDLGKAWAAEVISRRPNFSEGGSVIPAPPADLIP